MTSLKADKRLLVLLLLVLLLSGSAVVMILRFLLKGSTAFFVAVCIMLSALVIISLWLTLYFVSVSYERGDRCLKITSGIIIKKHTFIRTDNPLVVARYRLPLGTGFSVIYIYGGIQLILSTEVI